MRFSPPLLVTSVFVMLVATSQAQNASRSVAPSSGKALCSALTPQDFSKLGVPVTALKNANLDGSNGAYCVYTAKSQVEFDIFFPAGRNAAEVIATHKTVLGEGGSRYQPLQMPGADDAQISLAMPDLPGSAGIVVRKGNAVFDIVIPAGAQAKTQLLSLAQTVLSRLKL